MLIALGEVEQKLRHDADFVAEQAVSAFYLPRACLVFVWLIYLDGLCFLVSR